jgi:hypothetical protein
MDGRNEEAPRRQDSEAAKELSLDALGNNLADSISKSKSDTSSAANLPEIGLSDEKKLGSCSTRERGSENQNYPFEFNQGKDGTIINLQNGNSILVNHEGVEVRDRNYQAMTGQRTSNGDWFPGTGITVGPDAGSQSPLLVLWPIIAW